MSLPKFSRLDPGQRRDQILDAASALLAERPYDEVSIEDIASAAGVTRGLVHHYFGGRYELYIALLKRIGNQREDELRLPVGSSACARVADTVSRWLDWTEANRTIWLATSAHGEDIADADVADLLGRAVALLTIFHSDIAADSPRLRHALECWTAVNRAATRRWLRGEATRDATHELLASTLEHVLRTFGAPRATPPQASSSDQNRRAPRQPTATLPEPVAKSRTSPGRHPDRHAPGAARTTGLDAGSRLGPSGSGSGTELVETRRLRNA